MACCGERRERGVNQSGNEEESDSNGIEEKERGLIEGLEWEESISQSLFIKCCPEIIRKPMAAP